MPGYLPACGSYQSTDGEYELLETDNVGSVPTTRHALDLSEVRANGTERNRTSDGLSTADRTLYDLSKQYSSSLSPSVKFFKQTRAQKDRLG